MNQRQSLPQTSSSCSPEEQASTSSNPVQTIDPFDNEFNRLSVNSAHDPSQRGGDDSIDGLIGDEFVFPRCEYKSRFKDTTAFRMAKPNYWGTYFRTTGQGGNCDRIAAQNKKFAKTYTNENTNQSPKGKKIHAAKAGTFTCIWVHEGYKDIFVSDPKSPINAVKNWDCILYDHLLEYKKSMCSAAVEEFKKISLQDKKINVYYENDYPCVMVQVLDFHKKDIKLKERIRSFYRIVVAYFTAITNYIAKRENVPIELVNRASFGHNIPSVAETGTSFRINIGIVPKLYATEVLVRALEFLNDKFLAPFLNKNSSFELGMGQTELNDQNANIQRYNEKKNKKAEEKKQADGNKGADEKKRSVRNPKKVEQWDSKNNLFDVLRKVGDSSGREVCKQITRMKKYTDLLTDYVDKALNNGENLAEPLRQILKLLDYSDKIATLKVADAGFISTELTEFGDEERPDIANDKKFWNVIEEINSVFIKHEINIFPQSKEKNKIVGLYSELERANLEFIKNSGYQRAEDGYGSESDCNVSIEGEDGTIHFYSKKLIVSTGMRAINLAQYLSIWLTGTAEADTDHMYFETGDAIHSVLDWAKDLRIMRLKNGQKRIRYIDLTHCASERPDSRGLKLSAKQGEQVIVFDYTSATTESISDAIKLIEKVPVLLLVSSGLKNEQIGADTNPYGTIRIIARGKNFLNKLYSLLETALSEKERLPKAFHNIRKAYKDTGATVQSAGIYASSRGYGYSSYEEEYDESEEEEFSEFRENWGKISDLLFTDMYREEIDNLRKTHKVDINEIVSWTTDKIKCLGSSKVIKLVEEEFDNIFSQIRDEYDKDAELTNSVIGDITDDNVIAFNESVKEVFKWYRKLRYLFFDEQGVNILQIIAQQVGKKTLCELSQVLSRCTFEVINTAVTASMMQDPDGPDIYVLLRDLKSCLVPSNSKL